VDRIRFPWKRFHQRGHEQGAPKGYFWVGWVAISGWSILAKVSPHSGREGPWRVKVEVDRGDTVGSADEHVRTATIAREEGEKLAYLMFHGVRR